jgi:hypothetical protein
MKKDRKINPLDPDRNSLAAIYQENNEHTRQS